MIPLRPLIEDTCDGEALDLEPGETYWDEERIHLTKSIVIRGDRDTFVASEFLIDRCRVTYEGFNRRMMFHGAPSKTGVPLPYPQNGLDTLIGGAILWSTDVEWSSMPGLNKHAVYLTENSQLQARAYDRFCRFDWRNNPTTPLVADYNCYINLFGWSDRWDHAGKTQVWFNVPVNAAAPSAISLTGSRATLSGCNVSSHGGVGLRGLAGARGAFYHIGSGFPVTVFGFQYPNGLSLTSGSWRYIDVKATIPGHSPDPI